MSTQTTHKLEEKQGFVEEIAVSFKQPPFWVGQKVHIGHSDISLRYEVYTPNSSGQRSEWKDFAHYKCVTDLSNGASIPFATYYWSNGFDHFGFGNSGEAYCFYQGEYGVAGKLNSGLPVFVDESRLGTDIIAGPAKLNDLLAAGYTAILPIVRPKTSLVNSIIELKDIKSVAHTARNLKSFAAQVKSLPGFNPKWLKKTFRDLLRVISDLYLQHKFNYLPLKSDIEDVWTSLSRSEKRLNALASRAGRIQTAHFSRSLIENEDVKPDTWSAWSSLGGDYHSGWTIDNGPVEGSFQHQRFVTYDPSEFHLEVEYFYTYSNYQTEHARLLGLLDDLGVNFNPVIIWNAIPWSFAVDWVINVSQWLNSTQRIGWMDPALCIRRGLWSIRRSRSVLVQRKFKVLANMAGEVDQQVTCVLPMVRESAYRRQTLSMMDVIAGIKTSGLNSNELSLTAALVFSRKSRRRGRR